MKFMILTLLLCFSTFSFAWGPTGHRTVGDIAQKYLKKGVHRKITKILDGQSLSRVSNWPDKIRSDPENYAHTYTWHYTDWPNGVSEYDPHNNSGSIITSTDQQIKILRDKKSSKAEKAFAIKFIVHLIGDMHMPLHIGNGKDFGGSSCKVLFHKKPTNLHKLWDENMLEFTQLSFTELSQYITKIDKKTLRSYKKGHLLDWAKESKIIRETVYPKNFLDKKYCDRDNPLPMDQWPQLGYEYSYKFIPVIEKRLLQAGIRLAKILNKSF